MPSDPSRSFAPARPPVSGRTRASMIMLTIVAVVFFGVDTRGGFIHLRTEPWTDHALFHMVTGLFYTQALCIVVVILSWVPYRRAERWAWWTILFIGTAIHGGHIVGDIMTHGGLRGGGTAQGPGMIFYSLTIAALLFYWVALALGWSHFYPRPALPPTPPPPLPQSPRS